MKIHPALRKQMTFTNFFGWIAIILVLTGWANNDANMVGDGATIFIILCIVGLFNGVYKS